MSIQRCNTSQKVPRQIIATRRGRGVYSISSDHVVNAAFVDRVVRHADDGCEDQRRDPVHLRRTEGCPGEAEETD